ncbi:hypothetical protein GRS96_12545 [Rathayibacter sp. VKM Ac-2803]|uniref:helix-turn-helix domain-containing protein n=1 Tax=Rathayibacter sp. VKM Ac-2803 TaxID=2609256 RepID=UPI0013595551|nr:helix-turn-helix transcriptional regulator [Rathayibacter sp. VKM Ac-2803]MWV50098.1 hypothetical protein [Rathayibacter sp. VKM Ac-2803]
MTTSQIQPSLDVNMMVANNVRAELSRERWTGRKAAVALGLTPTYVSRRLSGETPMTPADLVMFSDFLSIPVGRFFAPAKPGTED